MSTFTGALSETKIHLVFHVCRGCKKTLTRAEFCDACLAVHASLKAREVDHLRTAVWTGLLIGCMAFWAFVLIHVWRWL